MTEHSQSSLLSNPIRKFLWFFISSSGAFLSFLIILCSVNNSFTQAHPTEFKVGGDKGWVVPTVKDDQLYNHWAANNRFNINDTLKFEYKDDSVLVVTKEEYEKCKSIHPIFFSNNGKSIYKLEEAGLYYFISGVSGHCERGLKMIIKVLEPATPPRSAKHTSTPKIAGANVVNVINGMVFVTIIIVGYFF